MDPRTAKDIHERFEEAHKLANAGNMPVAVVNVAEAMQWTINSHLGQISQQLAMIGKQLDRIAAKK